MKSQFTRIALAFASAVFLFSCTKTEVDGQGGGDTGSGDLVAAQINAGIGGPKTRVHDAQWDENDAIGLAMLVEDGSEVLNEVYNYHYITGANLGIFEPQSSAMMVYFPADGSLVTFRAYYPFYSGLGKSMLIPVDVSNQNVLPDIDLMSADHVSGNSKRDPVVRLYFHHRLSKLIFKLSPENGNDFPSMEDCTVTIRGMKTTGTYHLLEEELEVNDGSGQTITFPYRAAEDEDPNERYGIVLPREAAAGVEFDFTFGDGSKYTAKMDSNLDLLGGYQYTFYITLKETAATVSAEIAEWIDAPARYWDSVQASVDAGESVNVDPGTVMDVFLSGDNIDYSSLASFEYGTAGKWIPSPDVYWEAIPYNPAYMRSSIEMEAPLDQSQTGDWLTSQVVTVPRNTGAHFELSRAVSKLYVTLLSDQFTEEELNSATITLPGYLTGGYLENGAFVEGEDIADIVLVEDGGNTLRDAISGTRVALFQPQRISPDGLIATVTLNGRTYEVEASEAGFTYTPGVAEQFYIRLNKEGVSISATVVDWEMGPVTSFEAVQVSTVAGESHNVVAGDQIDVYKLEGAAWEEFTSYVYNADGKWYGSPIKYWEDIEEDPAYFIARMDAAEALNGTQLPDVLLSQATAGYSNRGIDFELTHAAAKVIVALVSDTFTDAQIASASMVLPGYKVGGSFVGSALVPGTGTGNINISRTDDISGVAIFEPQTIAAGQTVVRINFGGNSYEAKAPEGGITFDEGVATTLIVRFEKGEISVSVNVVDWKENTIELEALKVVVEAGSTTGVREKEKMDVWYGAQRELLNTYTYSQNNWTAPEGVYWENLGDPETFYAAILRQPAYNNTMPDDYLLSGPTEVYAPNAVNFTLRHAVARIAVVLESSDGSVPVDQLKAMDIVLPNYDTGGTYDRGLFVPGTGRTNVTVAKNVGDDETSAYAFVQEQTVAANTPVAIVSDDSRNVSYTVASATPVFFQAGYTTILKIDLRETAVLISANVVDWIDGETIEMVPAPIPITGKLEDNDGFFEGKTIYVYNMTDNTTVNPYMLRNGRWTGSNLYWQDYYDTGLSLTAVYYPASGLIPPDLTGQTAFDWNLPPDQSENWDRHDLLMSHLEYAAGVHTYFNFVFRHVVSQVVVRLRSDVFTDADLAGAVVVLNNFALNGQANLASGAIVRSPGTTASITPYTVTDGREYSALVMPQQITKGDQVLSIKINKYPDYTFRGLIDRNLSFTPGYITYIDVDLQNTEIELSATLEPWKDNGSGSVIIN